MAASRIIRLATAAATLFAGATAHAQTFGLSGVLAADNPFVVYLSTSDGEAGSMVVGGSQEPPGLSFALIAFLRSERYWLHVQASPANGAGSLIGAFTLTGDFVFANGTQSLTTNARDWTASTGGFGGPRVALAEAPLGALHALGADPAIDPDARSIWQAPPECDECTLYFSTPISSIGAFVAAPEPPSWAMLGTGLAGLVGLGATARRRRAA